MGKPSNGNIAIVETKLGAQPIQLIQDTNLLNYHFKNIINNDGNMCARKTVTNFSCVSRIR